MDVIKFTQAPIPVNLSGIRDYSKAVKDATFSGEFAMAKVSKKAKDLLADCCAQEKLPTPVPAFLEIFTAAENPSYLLLKPTMTETDLTLPVTVTKKEVKVDLRKLLAAKGLETVKGTRLVIPISMATIDKWGSALVLHMGALRWVPINRHPKPAAAASDLGKEKA